PFETRTIDLSFHVFPAPTTNTGDLIATNVTFNPVSNDATPGNNNFALNQIVVASFDPNDITCLEGDQVQIEDADKYLHYIIRFQNTGTADAVNVRLENTLDSKLDWTSMQFENASHIVRTEITDGSYVKFIFNDIYLPALADDEPHSHGFVAYKIKPRADVVVGDVVHNNAAIYFDFNSPVITNTAATVFMGNMATMSNAVVRFDVFPNPTNGMVAIKGNAAIEKVVVIDINGRILKELNFNNPNVNAQIDIADLSKGIYFLKIKSSQGIANRKIIKK
ncbi:MAG TPA: T9SS type A sorting domain-containing protein, partial [Flavobacterium sp.]|nr:T9SS type A sorting domain-containing protein [Flavobacterium sp.]